MTATPEVESGRLYNALCWAKVQSAGPQEVPVETPAVAGLTRAASPAGGSVWLVPTLPSGAGHGVLDELGTPPVAVEQPNETARVLAICVACCWQDRSGSLWPGVVGTLGQVRAVYAGLRGRVEQLSDLTWIIGSLRRLHATAWILWDEKTSLVRLGPRVITWGPQHQAALRELCRVLPTPPPAEPRTLPPPADTSPSPTLPTDTSHSPAEATIPSVNPPTDGSGEAG